MTVTWNDLDPDKKAECVQWLWFKTGYDDDTLLDTLYQKFKNVKSSFDEGKKNIKNHRSKKRDRQHLPSQTLEKKAKVLVCL